MRRIITILLTTVVVLAGLGLFARATSSGSSVTKPRLERSIAVSFSNVYSQQAALLGHKGISPKSLHAQAMCDKGPGVPQNGPGTSWVCLMSWDDPNVPMPTTGYGKFELSVHSNSCYTAGGPSSLIGYQTIAAADGRTVNNPVYEFDACFDPQSDNTPTRVTFPSAVRITSTTATPDDSGRLRVDLACAEGAGGCRGTLTGTADGSPLGVVDFSLTKQATDSLNLPGALPTKAKNVTYTVTTTAGVAPPPLVLPVQR
ncbi:hypothetical protein [Nocardioides jensenii]|uniref:hypothetical protein n=1 Tax=Nocardioides jensenii TaxID=1843 RepID=UPI00082CA766|nr:hypothetical protein [Nocardioides jensenii]